MADSRDPSPSSADRTSEKKGAGATATVLERIQMAVAPGGDPSAQQKSGGHRRLASQEDGTGGLERAAAAVSPQGRAGDDETAGSVAEGDAASARYRVYKRRWFGLVQLTLLNIIVSWDVSSRDRYLFFFFFSFFLSFFLSFLPPPVLSSRFSELNRQFPFKVEGDMVPCLMHGL